MSNLIEHAKRELTRAGFYSKSEDEHDDSWGEMIAEAVMQLIEVFAEQGHSGGSAPQAVAIFSKLANYGLLAPVQNEEELQFYSVADIPGNGPLMQSAVMSAVFKESPEARPHYIDAIEWKTQNGSKYSGLARTKDGKEITGSHYIRFPFMPKTFVVDVTEHEVAPDDWEFVINDDKQLEEVFKYYDERPIIRKAKSTEPDEQPVAATKTVGTMDSAPKTLPLNE